MSLTPAREVAVLSVVLAHPAHGYDIAAAFDRGPLALLGLKKSAVYSILARFVKRGWVEERVEDAGAYPDRLTCYATDAGRAALPDLLDKAIALPQTPAMALALLADGGHDVAAPAARARDLRRALLAGMGTDDHGHPMITALARATMEAELSVLDQLAGKG